MMYHIIALSHNEYNIFHHVDRELLVYVDASRRQIDCTSTLSNGYRVHTEIDGSGHFMDVQWSAGNESYVDEEVPKDVNFRTRT